MITQWSKEAKNNYDEVINYLSKNWTKKEVKNFHHITFKTVGNIELNPYMYPSLEENSNIRKAKVTRQNSLFYLVKRNTIFLITFWNEYRNPEHLKELLSSYL